MKKQKNLNLDDHFFIFLNPYHVISTIKYIHYTINNIKQTSERMSTTVTLQIEFENTVEQTKETFVRKEKSEQVTIDDTIENVLEAQNIVNTQLTEKMKQKK